MKTWEAAVKSYLENCRINGLSEDSIASYAGTLTFFGNHAGKSHVSMIEPTDIMQWKTVLSEKGNALSTIMLRLRHLKQFFEYAFSLRWCESNPFVNSLMPKRSFQQSVIEDANAIDVDNDDSIDINSYQHTLTLYQYGKLLSAERPHRHSKKTFLRDRAIVAIALTSGLRASEICTLEPRHINFKKDFVLVVEGKGRKTAVVPLLGACKEYLVEYLQWNTRQPNELLFGIKSRSMLSDIVERYVKQSVGVKNIRAHALRHGCAIIMKRALVPDDIREDIMRHSGRFALDKRYAGKTRMEVMQEFQQKAFEDIVIR